MSRQFVTTSTIGMSIAEEGDGPLILLCHGFLETSYAWRHQVDALAQAGFRAVAPDMRGVGGSDRPLPIDAYTVFDIVGDMVALLDALDEDHALIVGNDWGATIAWEAARMRPDRFKGIVALSVPIMARSPSAPTSMFPHTDDAQFYTLYFQEPGIAEAEFEKDVRLTLRKLLFAASGDAGPRRPGGGTPNPFGMVPRGRGLLDPLPDPEKLPPWLSDADLDVYAEAFTRSGFRGALNYYRNLDRNWRLQASLAGRTVDVPAMFMVGERDTGLAIPGMREMIEAMPAIAPQLRESLFVPGAGHWLQQEKPDDVSRAIVSFAQDTLLRSP